MNFKSKIFFLLSGLCLAVNVNAQTVFSKEGKPTGEPLAKPMVMKPFIEFTIARALPPLKLFTLNGESVDLNKYKGKLLILNVWGTWCTPCIREIPQLIELQKKFKDSDIVIQGVSIDTSVTKIPEFLKKHKGEEFQTWSDPTESTGNILPLEVVPTNLIIDGEGNLVGYLPGYLPWDDKAVVPFLESLAKKYAKPNYK